MSGRQVRVLAVRSLDLALVEAACLAAAQVWAGEESGRKHLISHVLIARCAPRKVSSTVQS